MKWVFFILVALNLIVFGTMMARKVNHPAAASAASVPIVVVAAPPGQSTALHSPTASAAAPAAASEQNTPEQIAQAREQKSHEEALKKERKDKAREQEKKEKSKKDQELAAQDTKDGLSAPAGNCSASVRLPEDVYHRIKGLLNRWQNAASRNVVQNPKAGKAKIKTSYTVIAVATGDVNAAAAKLAGMGFAANGEGGRFTIGTYKDRAQANKVREKISAAGLGASISEGSGSDESLSMVVYDVVFANVSNADAAGIEGIVKPYAKLHRGACKK